MHKDVPLPNDSNIKLFYIKYVNIIIITCISLCNRKPRIGNFTLIVIICRWTVALWSLKS